MRLLLLCDIYIGRLGFLDIDRVCFVPYTLVEPVEALLRSIMDPSPSVDVLQPPCITNPLHGPISISSNGPLTVLLFKMLHHLRLIH